MKNLLLILAFVLISLTGFSQTFTLSSNTPGIKQQSYTVSIPQGHGYNYSYNLNAQNSTVYIISQYKGTLAMLDNPAGHNRPSSSGSGVVSSGAGGGSLQYQDIIILLISNPYFQPFGYASITVYPY